MPNQCLRCSWRKRAIQSKIKNGATYVPPDSNSESAKEELRRLGAPIVTLINVLTRNSTRWR